jgi:FKBP-type peptidyl-prolyl cis-trans isomerase
MQVGGQRRVIIPPDLAYGSAPPSTIPVNATLVFDITLTLVQ